MRGLPRTGRHGDLRRLAAREVPTEAVNDDRTTIVDRGDAQLHDPTGRPLPDLGGVDPMPTERSLAATRNRIALETGCSP